MGTDEEDTLFRRETKRDAVVASEWPSILQQYISRPDNSPNVPGNDSISLSYGRRVPRILLLRSKVKLLQGFLSEYVDCPFKVRVLLREFPCNCVCAGPRDFGRNVCVLHTNFRNKINMLMKHGFLSNCLNSCGYLCSLPLCSSGPEFQHMSPVTWEEKCATGHCTHCPFFTLMCPQDKEDTVVPLSQWCTKFCEIKQKNIHSLFTESVSLSTLVKQFNSDLMKLSGHIYRAACQWSAYQADLDSLQPGHLTMVVDYQMNGTILHKNSTTSSHMSANTAQFCIYPAFLAMRLTDGRVVRGGIIFLSRDTKHDRHQVKVFHGLIKELMQKKYGSEVTDNLLE